MSWAIVAKKDVQDALRSRLLIVLTLLFVIVAGGYGYLNATTPSLVTSAEYRGGSSLSTVALLSGMQASASLLVPLVAIAISYKAIVGERDSGSLKLLLGLPHTRRDVISGKLLGRTIIVLIPTIIGFAVSGIVVFAYSSSFAGGKFIGFVFITLVYVAVFVSISIAFSAAMRSASRALYGAAGFLVLFEFVWYFIPLLIRYLINGFSVPNTLAPRWAMFLSFLNPQAAYRSALTVVFPSLQLNATALSQPPFYLQNWFGFIILAVWLILPIGIGYRQFGETDLQ